MTKLPDHEFKAGDVVYVIRKGWTKLKENHIDICYPLIDSRGISYKTSGKMYGDDHDRAILTIEEAAKLGLHPPMRKVVKKEKRWVNVLVDEAGHLKLAQSRAFWANRTKQSAEEEMTPPNHKRVGCCEMEIDVEVYEVDL